MHWDTKVECQSTSLQKAIANMCSELKVARQSMLVVKLAIRASAALVEAVVYTRDC